MNFLGKILRDQLRCWGLVLLVVIAGSRVAAQNLDTNTVSTNQFGTNVVVTDTSSTNNELPPETNTFGTLPPLTNVVITAVPVQPPLLGPRTTYFGQLNSPLLGTSAISAPPSSVVAGSAGTIGPGFPVWGPIMLHPTLSYSYSYGTGIQDQPGQPKGTSVQTFSAGFLFNVGSQLTLNYTPSYTVFSDASFQNTLSQGLVLSDAFHYEDWSFNFSQNYSYVDTPLIETGAQTAEQGVGTSLSAGYSMGPKVSLQFGLSQSLSFAEGFEQTKSWSGSTGINYQFIPPFGMGLSFSGGLNEESQGSSSPFESIQVNLNFRAGRKLYLTLSGGVEDTQFINPSAPSLLSPVYSASLNYQVTRFTTFTASGSQTINPSYFANQLEMNTSLSASLQQQLSRKISLVASFGYSTEPLTSIVAQPLPQYFVGMAPRTSLVEDEHNDTTSFGLSLSYAIVRYGSIALFYSRNQNTSSQQNFSFTSTQVGVSASYGF